MKNVDIIITTYKRKFDILKTAIDSALSQTYKNITVAVVNDNSDDDYGREIDTMIKQYGSKIRYFNYDGNHGACYARNYGSKKLNGDYIAFLDDDDVWHSNKIEKQVAAIENTNSVMVMCDSTYKIYSKNNELLKEKYMKKTSSEYITLEELLDTNVIGGCSIPLIRRDIFEKCNGFTESLPSAQDYDLWLKIIQEGKIFHINESLLDYNIKQIDRISRNNEKKIIGYEYLINNYSNLSNNPTEFKTNKYFQLGKFCCENNDFKLGNHFLRYALKQNFNIKNFIKYVKLYLYYFLVSIKRGCSNEKK